MSRERSPKRGIMAAIGTASGTRVISPRFQKLLKDVTADLSQEELKHAVSSIKSNFEGKFNAQGEQDLYSCLHLFANQGLLSEDNLTLLERFIVTPKTSTKEGIVTKIQSFKETRSLEQTKRKELTGRKGDLTHIMTKLTSIRSSVLNLYGSSGVGKTRLATEALSQWKGTAFKVDLRGINDMSDVHFHVLQALSAGTVQKTFTVSYEANPVIAKMQQVKQHSTSDILLLLDNADQFSGGTVQSALNLNTSFATFLNRLLRSETGEDKVQLKILLTSRSEFRHDIPLDIQNHEVKALEREYSGELLQTHGTSSIQGNQRERLVGMCQGKPLLLNGMAAILRQEIADAEKLLGTIEQELEVQPQDTVPPAKGQTQERETFDLKDEGIDEEQLSCLRKMFFFLPSQKLKDSAISVSLFCRPFSLEAAAKILDVDPSEAAIRMEGIRNSGVISAPEDKELLYDIHPLMRKFLKSIGSSKTFTKAYQKAKENFCKHFISQMRDISALLDKEYMKAFNSFDFDKQNFELALDISLKSDYLLIPTEHRESIMICYLFEAMLDGKQRRKIFNSWAEKVEDDGKEGKISLGQR